MKKVLAFLLHPLTLAVVGLLALALVLWFVGPLVMIGTWRPLDTALARLVLILLIVAAYAAVKLVAALRARVRNRKVVSELAAAGAAAAESGEVAQLRTRFQEALAVLRNAPVGTSGGYWSKLSWRLGGRYLYQLPWYVMIGAPGSGKTTALLNSGLRFPLAERLGAGAVKGVGGTRNCDWWFAEQAVLLDTAGRYTTQESDPEADRKAWSGFLALLKRARPRRPLNGALATVSVTDLLSFSGPQRSELAATLRRRIDELQQQLGLRLPVYVLVTKCDLLAGFMDYFAEGDRLERGQPWGFTFDEKPAASGAAASFGGEFDLLTQRLLDGVVDRIQSERDRDRRARIYGFPQQFGGLRTALAEMVEVVGAASSYGVTPMLRGVYFVSGTQEGTPLDRLLGTFAREFRLEAAILPPNRSTGRSFFISQVLSDVVFAEADLAGTNPAAERRRLIATWGAYGALGIASVLLLVGWTISYFNNRGLIDAFGGRIGNLRTLVSATPNRATAELSPIEPMLDAAADLARPADSVPMSLGLGLYQGEKLRTAADVVYGRMLVDALLPRIALRIEQLMRSSGENQQLLYEALKAYMMLHSPENYDRKALQQFVAADWDSSLAGQLTPDQRTALDHHLQRLFELPVAASPLAEDRTLVEAVRTQIMASPLPQRVYARLKWLGVGSDIPEFTIARAAGTQGQLVFRRRSDLPLTRGMPGLFTYDGYHRAFQSAVVAASEQLSDEESWVLGSGTRKSPLPNALQGQQVADAVRNLYLHEYVNLWDAFIADIKLTDASGVDQILQQARILSAPDNPLVPLLRAISHETTLLGGGNGQGLADRAEAKARNAIEGTRQQLGKIFGGAAGTSPLAQPERIVDDHFADLRALVNGPGGDAPPPINATIALIGEAYNNLNVAAAALRERTPPPPDTTSTKVRAEAARLPDPLRSLLGDLANSAQGVTRGQERENLGKLVNAQIGQFCRQAIEGRYPFNRASDKEVTQEDFARVFGPGGLFDDFFTKNLSTKVDTSTRPWTFRHGEGAFEGDRGALAEFQRASVIRDTFFRGGAQTPSLRMEFTPFDMDATITQFNLDVDGQLVQWSFGPKIPKSVLWPGPRGSGQVRLTLAPAGAGASGVVTNGPWALFRMFDRMLIEPSNSPEKFRVTFIVEGRKAIFDVTASSVQNPFTLRELREFHCPMTL